MHHRAYSLLNIKAVSDDKRIITGVATSPEPDRVGDIVDPLGVKFANPMPLLWHHDSKLPVGKVWFKKPTKDGIDFEAHLPHVTEPGPLKDRVDTAWGEVKYGLVPAVSIGFRELEFSRLESGGLHFIESEVLELSLVSIPAQQNATIQTIKSIDAPLLAASGQTQSSSDVSTSAGVTARKSTRVVTAKEAKHTMSKKTIAEQISAFEATRQAKAARMNELMTKASDEGITLDEAESEEYDGLAIEVKKVDEHLVRLAEMEKSNKAAAKPINGDTHERATETRGGGVISVKANVPKGTAFSRYVWASVAGKLKDIPAAEIAKQWRDQTPEVEKALIAKTAVAAGTTTNSTWASPLVELQNLTSEFAELLRPATIIGRIPGIRRVPFNIKVPRETTGASVSWVGEGGVKPVGAMAFDQIELLFTKVAGIVPVTEELFRFSSPAVEEIIRNSLRDAVAYLTDRDFLDPTKSEVVGVSPASITNGVTPIASTGTTADALRADLGSLLSEYAEANMGLSSLVLVMTAVQAMRISLMRNTLGQRDFEGLGRDGGTLEGIPVIVSENIVATGTSPVDGGMIVAINASEILMADDGDVTIDLSREASLQMETAPDSPETTSTVMVSLWQRNLVALRAERFINWKKRRAEAVQFISYTKYA